MAESPGVDQNRRQTRIELNNVLHSVLRQLQSENLDENLIDRVQYRLDWIYNTVVRYVDLDIVDERVVNCIRLAKECLQQNSGSNSNTFQLAAETVFTGERGRPRLHIPFEQLEFLLEKRFKIDEIAQLFITSKRTVERRMRDFGLSAANVYTSLSDQQLDAVITDIQRDFPNVGCKRITGLLRARGIHMQQTRIRQSMRRVDPEEVLLRALEMSIIRRRHYSVAGPLSLWHIDGNHKLIRYDITSNEFYNVNVMVNVVCL